MIKTRRRRILLVAGAAVIIGALVSVLVVRASLSPAAVRERVIEAVNSALGGASAAVDVDSATLGFSDGLAISGLRLGVDSRPILEITSVRAELDAAALLVGSISVRSVTVGGLTLRATRLADGSWAHGELLDALSMDDSDGGIGLDMPDLAFEDCRLMYRDERDGVDRVAELTIEGLSATVNPTRVASRTSSGRDARAELRFSARGRESSLGDFSAAGAWEIASRSLRVDRFNATMDLGSPDEHLVPPRLLEALRGHRVAGRIETLGRFRYGARTGLRDVDVVATLSRAGATFSESEFTLASGTATIRLTEAAITVESFSALTPAGGVEGRGAIAIERDENGDVRVRLSSASLAFPRVDIDDALLARLPGDVSALLEKHAIRGAVALDASIEQAVWPPDFAAFRVRARPLGVRFRYERFPFPVDLLSGALELSGGKLRTEPALTGSAGTGTIEANVDLDLLDDAGELDLSGEIRIRAVDFTTTRELTDALNEKEREIFDAFDPVGTADVDIRIAGTRGEDQMDVRVEVNPRGVKFRFRQFPVTIDRVDGALVFDFKRGIAEIPLLTGRHRQRSIEGRGVLNLAPDDRTIDLRITSPSVTLTREILAALPERARALIEENRVSGDGSLLVHITRGPGDEHAEVAVDVGLENVVVHPSRSPFPILLDGGRLAVRRDLITLDDVTSSSSPKFRLDASLDSRNGRTLFTAAGRIDELVADGRLLSIFDARVRRRLQALHLEGKHAFDFECEVTRPPGDEAPWSYSYRIMDWRTRGAEINVGIRVGDIVLQGEIDGRGTLGVAHELEGVSTLESATLNRLRFGSSRLEFVYGKPHPALAGAGDEASSPQIDKSFTRRITPPVAARSLQILANPASIYGGEVRGFFFADLESGGEMRGSFRADRIDLSAAARGIHRDESLRTTGSGSGQVRFSGATGNPESLVGVGSVKVDGANFADIPVISSTVKTITEDGAKSLAFNSLETKFSIHDRTFETDGQMLIRGPGVNLRGEGTLDFYGVLNLSFTPEFLGALPIPLVDLVEKNVAEVRITGPLEQPRASLRVLRVPVRLRRSGQGEER